MTRWILLLFALPCVAQFKELRFEVQGTDCISCNASLPERLKRIRGVESVTLEGSTAVLKFAVENRVRFEQLRDMIEQDGTKVKSATLIAKGKHEGDAFKVGTTQFALPAGTNLPPDEIQIAAKVKEPHTNPIRLEDVRAQ
jgi:cation transport ATPase